MGSAVIKALLFDLDGTLVETHRANHLAYSRALAELGYEVTYEQFQRTIGMQAKAFLPLIAPGITAEQMEQVARRKAAIYPSTMGLTVLNDPLVAFLRSMQQSHFLALVTTAKRANAMAVLTEHRLLECFDLVVAAEDVAESKPSPEGYLKALQHAGVQADEAIAFEDSDTGIAAAKAAGIAVVVIDVFGSGE